MCDEAQRMIAEARSRVYERMARELSSPPSSPGTRSGPTTPSGPAPEVVVRELIPPVTPPRHDPQIYQRLQHLNQLSRNPVPLIAVPDCPPPMPPIGKAYEDPELWREVKEFDPLEHSSVESNLSLGASPSNYDLLCGMTEEVDLTGGVEDILGRARHRAMLRAGLGAALPLFPQPCAPGSQLEVDDTEFIEDEDEAPWLEAEPEILQEEAEFEHQSPSITRSCPFPTQAGPFLYQADPFPTQAGPLPTQAGPFPTQAGPCFTQAGPSFYQSGSFPTQAGPSHTQAGPSHTQAGPSHTHAGPSHTQNIQYQGGSESQLDQFGLPYRRYPNAERRREQERKRLEEERRWLEQERCRLEDEITRLEETIEPQAEEPPRATRGPQGAQWRPRKSPGRRPTRAGSPPRTQPGPPPRTQAGPPKRTQSSPPPRPQPCPPPRTQAGPPPRTQAGPPIRTQSSPPPRPQPCPPPRTQAGPPSMTQAGPSRTRTVRQPPPMPARGQRAADEKAAKTAAMLEAHQKRTKYQPPRLKCRPPSKPPTKPKAPRGLDERGPQRKKGPDPTRDGYINFGFDGYLGFEDPIQFPYGDDHCPRDLERHIDLTTPLSDPVDCYFDEAVGPHQTRSVQSDDDLPWYTSVDDESTVHYPLPSPPAHDHRAWDLSQNHYQC